MRDGEGEPTSKLADQHAIGAILRRMTPHKLFNGCFMTIFVGGGMLPQNARILTTQQGLAIMFDWMRCKGGTDFLHTDGGVTGVQVIRFEG